MQRFADHWFVHKARDITWHWMAASFSHKSQISADPDDFFSMKISHFVICHFCLTLPSRPGCLFAHNVEDRTVERDWQFQGGTQWK